MLSTSPLNSKHASTATSASSKSCGAFFDFDHKKAECEAINQRLSSPEVWQDQKTSQSLQQKKKRLERDLEFFDRIREQKDEIEVLAELRAEGENVEADIAAALARFEKALSDGELRALFFDENDPRNAILTIHPGAGGT